MLQGKIRIWKLMSVKGNWEESSLRLPKNLRLLLNTKSFDLIIGSSGDIELLNYVEDVFSSK